VRVPILSGASQGQSLGRLPDGRLWRWGLPALLLLAAALLTRVPGLIRPWFERDEAYIGVQAEALRRGEQLYVDVIDRKPPLAPAVYAAVSAVFGADFRPIRLLLVLWVAATAVLVMALVVRLGASRRAGVIGGVLYVLGTVAFLPRDAQGANYELWAVLPTVAAVLVALRTWSEARRAYAFALAGALVGLATSFKQPFAATLVPVGIAAVRGSIPVRSVLAACGAVVGTVLAIGSYFGLPEMIRWVWMENDEYALGLDLRVVAVAVLVTGLFALAHSPAVWLALRALRQRIPHRGIVLVWLGVSVLAAAAGFRFRLHYYQQALPPLCVLAGIGSDAVRPRLRVLAVAATAVIAAVAVGAALSPAAPKPQKLHPLVSFIDARTVPDDPILVWGTIPEIYWRADRPVAGRFVHHQFVVRIGDREVDAREVAHDQRLRERWDLLLADLRDEPPVLVLDASHRDAGGFGTHAPEEFPLGPFLHDEYTQVATIRGTRIWQYTPG
jgi:Dolichyl-phosphate-mannose-protein mannosyltransferase